MNYYEAMCDVYGKKLESIGFLPQKNFWYKISRSGIASFVGTRKLYYGNLEFWAASQPVFSDFCSQTNNITTPTPTYFNLAFFLKSEKNRLCHSEVTAKSLVNHESLRLEITEQITNIVDNYLFESFSKDMAVSECLHLNNTYMNLCLSHMKQNHVSWRNYTFTQIEMMLFLHFNYDVCLEFYKSLTHERLLSSIHMQFLAKNAEEEAENSSFIENMIKSYEYLAPADCIKMCVNNGMVLNSRYNERDYSDRFHWAKNTYKNLISLIESDDYNGILNYLKQKHESSSQKCQQLFNCKILPFSCYLK